MSARGRIFRALPAAALSCTAAATIAACGTASPDLFVMKRDGTVPGAKLELLVSDQTARCNNGPIKDLPSKQILEARDLRDDLLEVQGGLVAVPQAPPSQIFSYAVTTEAGTLRYPDTAQRPEVLPRLTRFVRRVAIDLCGLER